MDRAVHVVDERMGAESAYALAAFLRGGDSGGGRVVSVGPAPRGLTWAPVAVLPAYGTLLERARWFGVRMGGGLAKHCGGASAVHCWSVSAMTYAADLALDCACPLTLHLPSACAATGCNLARWEATLCGGRDEIAFGVTVPASPSAERLIADGLSPEAVTVWPPAALSSDERDGCPRDERRRLSRRALGVTDDTRLIVAPDEMVRAAGLKFAVWAHAILRHVTPRVRLCMPSAGPGLATLRHFAEAAGFSDEILWPRAEIGLTDALSAADVAAFVREDDLGLSVPATARAMNLPILATDTPDVRNFLNGQANIVPIKDPRQMATALLNMLGL